MYFYFTLKQAVYAELHYFVILPNYEISNGYLHFSSYILHSIDINFHCWLELSEGQPRPSPAQMELQLIQSKRDIETPPTFNGTVKTITEWQVLLITSLIYCWNIFSKLLLWWPIEKRCDKKCYSCNSFTYHDQCSLLPVYPSSQGTYTKDYKV